MKVLIGVDGSDAALRAVDTAAAIFGGAAGVKFLLVIVDEDRSLEGTLTPADLGAASEKGRARLQAHGHAADLVLEAGQPATRIVAAAAAKEADVIVVGRRGLHGLSRLLSGSVSAAVLRRAHVPVLVVP